MWNSITVNTIKLVPDQKSSRTDNYASKIFNKLKIHAAPFVSNSNSYLQSKNSSKMSPYCDLVDISGPYKISYDKSYETPFSQRFSHKMPYSIPTIMSNKAPQIIGGYVGTKSHCTRKESDLNSLIMNLFNYRLQVDKHESDVKSEVTPTSASLTNRTSIAAEVEKYFSQRKKMEEKEKKNEDLKSTICSAEITGKNQMTITSSTSAICKPICAVQPIVKLTESRPDENSMSESYCKSAEMDEDNETSFIEASASDPKLGENSTQKNQYCSSCSAKLQTDKKNCKSKKKGKLNKQKVQNSIDKCFCTKEVDTVKESDEIKPKCNARKSRKSKQKRKLKLKQCRERQLITMKSGDPKAKFPSLLNEVETPSSEDDNSKNWEDVSSSEKSVTATGSNISNECVDFEIEFDCNFETELCGVHSSTRPLISDTSSISFILNGNHDDSETDESECEVDTESDGEFDECWQSFKNPFSSSCLIFESQGPSHSPKKDDDYDDVEARVEINFDNDGFEILICGNVSEDYDDYSPLSQSLKDVNRRWNEETKSHSYSKAKTPKVHFAPEDSLVQVKMITLTCEDERKSPWEQFSRDRCRFRDRITRTEVIISPILGKDHRDTMYNTRFDT